MNPTLDICQPEFRAETFRCILEILMALLQHLSGRYLAPA